MACWANISKALVADELPPPRGLPPPVMELMAAMAKAADRLRSSGLWEVLGIPGIPGSLICPAKWGAIAAAA